jgi:hypothetical protein
MNDEGLIITIKNSKTSGDIEEAGVLKQKGD